MDFKDAMQKLEEIIPKERSFCVQVEQWSFLYRPASEKRKIHPMSVTISISDPCERFSAPTFELAYQKLVQAIEYDNECRTTPTETLQLEE